MGKKRLSPSRRPLPEDLIPDILLRLSPDDPAGLVRASTVCKTWRRIITDPAFLGRYRTLHPTAPVLGFLHNPSGDNELPLPRFVSTTSFRAAAADHRQHVLDCRHGRAVFFDHGNIHSYAAWDPATGDLHKLPNVGDEYLPHLAVFCAAAEYGGSCDHRGGCSGGPYIVAYVGVELQREMEAFASLGDDDDDDDDETTDDDEDHCYDAHACFYDSDTGKLAGIIDVHLEDGRYSMDHDRPAALVGDSLYYLCWPGILRYRIGFMRSLDDNVLPAGIREDDVLFMMELPRWERLGMSKNTDDIVIMTAEGGGLGLACLCPTTRTTLYLLARETAEGTVVGDDDAAAAGVVQWVQRRVIDLKTLLPVGNDPKRQPCLRGLAQDTNVIFVSTEDGVFSIELGRSSSLQTRKVCDKGVVGGWMYPFVSFYTESLLLKLASSKLPPSVGNQ